MKNSFLFILSVICLMGCKSHSISISPELNLCSSLSLNDYANTLYSDTLAWSGDTETINLYTPKIEQILKEIESNCNKKSMTVYPFKKIDRVVLYNNSVGVSGTELKKEQVIELLNIINDPLNFGWGETTFETEKTIVFESEGKEIAKLKIMGTTHILSKPENKMMKTGELKEQGMKKFAKLLKSI